MQIITEDPNEVIPNFSENILKDKVILAVLSGERFGTWIAQIIKDDNKYFLKGQNLEYNTGNFDYWHWTMSHEGHESILHLISSVWQTYKHVYIVKVFILNNWIELAQVISKYQGEDQEELRHVLNNLEV